MKLRLPDLGRYADHARRWRATAVIEQGVDRAQLLAGRVDGTFHARPIREVGGEAKRAGASRFDFRYGAVEDLGAGGVRAAE